MKKRIRKKYQKSNYKRIDIEISKNKYENLVDIIIFTLCIIVGCASIYMDVNNITFNLPKLLEMSLLCMICFFCIAVCWMQEDKGYYKYSNYIRIMLVLLEIMFLSLMLYSIML